MTVDDLGDHLRDHWPEIRRELLEGRYCPQPLRRVMIPKDGGGKRQLSIPTVLDRFVQQALLQVLQPRWDATFSEHSYGFRPGRSAHQAIATAQAAVASGHVIVVDLDLERFFDEVNRDMLMGRVAKRVGDKRVLKLLRAFLNAGVLADGVVRAEDRGMPQGGPISPLLSNLLLDDLDRELERRGHRFARYADDVKVFVKTERAGHRVMESLARFVTRKLKLKVNRSKSAVAPAKKRSFLSFSFTGGRRPRRRIAPKAIRRFKRRIRVMIRESRGRSVDQIIEEVSSYLRGWRAYFGFCETRSVLRDLDSWIRRRLRCLHWRQWKTAKNRYTQLRRRGVDYRGAMTMVRSRKGPWRLSQTRALNTALPNAYFDDLGLYRLHR